MEVAGFIPQLHKFYNKQADFVTVLDFATLCGRCMYKHVPPMVRGKYAQKHRDASINLNA